MSKTLLAVMSWAGAAKQVSWSLPYYQRSGFDILGTCPVNSTHDWPAGTTHVQPVGEAGYIGPVLIRRWVQTIELLLSPRFAQYDNWCIVEYDSIFLRPPPPFPGSLYIHHAGTFPVGLNPHDTRFYHCPWWFDRPAGDEIVRHAHRLMSENRFQMGSPDVFLGKIIHDSGLPWTETYTFSVNGGGMAQFMPQAIIAAKGGAWHFHGLRTEAEAQAIDAAAP